MAYTNCNNKCGNICNEPCNPNVLFVQGPPGEMATENYMLIGLVNTNDPLLLNTVEIINFDEVIYESGTTIEAGIPTTQVQVEGNHTYLVSYKVTAQIQGLVEAQMRAGLLLNNEILNYTVNRVHVVSQASNIELENSFLVSVPFNSTLSLFVESLGPADINLTNAYMTIVQIR